MLRVNIDRTNQDAYHLIHRELRQRFAAHAGEKRVAIYPGIVHDHSGGHPDSSCLFDRDAEAAFTIEQHVRHGIDDLASFPARSSSGCTACRQNAYVIGPEGELYKCWNDIGRPERRVGSVGRGCVGNPALVADYLVGASYLDDPKCNRCFYLPVCDGGCPTVRLDNYLTGSRKAVCSKFKNSLEALLEVHYERRQRQASEPGLMPAEAPTPATT